MLTPATKPIPKMEDGTRKRRPKTEPFRQARRRSPEHLATPYSCKPEIKSEYSSRQFDRDLSNSPPPFLNYPFSLPDPALQTTYPQHIPFNTLPAPYPEYSAPQQYNTTPLPPTLPSMPPYEQSKQGCFYDNDDVLSQYPMGFAPFTSMELPMNQSYQDSNAHVNHPEYRFHLLQ